MPQGRLSAHGLLRTIESYQAGRPKFSGALASCSVPRRTNGLPIPAQQSQMADPKLRQAIAHEAARLMYERVESEYFTAKMKAAKRLCRDRNINPEERDTKKWEYFILTRDPEFEQNDKGEILRDAYQSAASFLYVTGKSRL